MQRLDEIENVVNKGCNKHALIHNGFTIGYSQRQNLLTLYNKDLRGMYAIYVLCVIYTQITHTEHTAVSHGKCAKAMKNVAEYKHKDRNKLNRWKHKV